MNKHIPAAAIFASLIACALAAVPAPASIPPALQPPPGERLAFALDARGDQIYVCKPLVERPADHAWAFVAPVATLFEGGVAVGHHGAGPTWQSASDYSSVKGAVRAKQDGGSGNIAWLLLAATASEHAGGEAGKFTGVTSVLRLATRGGVEPGEKCDASTAGRQVQVPYTATYYFYKRGEPKESYSRY